MTKKHCFLKYFGLILDLIFTHEIIMKPRFVFREIKGILGISFFFYFRFFIIFFLQVHRYVNHIKGKTMGDFFNFLRFFAIFFSINFFFTAVSNIKNEKNRQTGKQTHFLNFKKSFFFSSSLFVAAIFLFILTWTKTHFFKIT